MMIFRYRGWNDENEGWIGMVGRMCVGKCDGNMKKGRKRLLF